MGVREKCRCTPLTKEVSDASDAAESCRLNARWRRHLPAGAVVKKCIEIFELTWCQELEISRWHFEQTELVYSPTRGSSIVFGASAMFAGLQTICNQWPVRL